MRNKYVWKRAQPGRPALLRFLDGVVVAVFLCAIGQAIAWAAETHRVAQKNRAFQIDGIETKDITIAAGDEVQFVNNDTFLHQIYVASGGLDFDSAEQPPGEVISVKFPKAGSFDIRCHIHPKMALLVTVK